MMQKQLGSFSKYYELLGYRYLQCRKQQQLFLKNCVANINKEEM